MRSLVPAVLASSVFFASTTTAEPASPSDAAAGSKTVSDGKIPNGKRLAGPSEDLRYGHLLISVFGGLWGPSGSFVVDGRGLTVPGPGADGRLRIGMALNGTVAVFAEGSVGRASGSDGCDACATTSVTGGLGLEAYLTQGFAVDPWISLGMAYRNTMLSVDDVPRAVSDAPIHGFDFGRVAFGFDHRPVPWLGLGTFVASDVGIRLFDQAVYADLVVGLRLTFDPKAGGTRLTINTSR